MNFFRFKKKIKRRKKKKFLTKDPNNQVIKIKVIKACNPQNEKAITSN